MSMVVAGKERRHAGVAEEPTAEEESSPSFVTAEECMRYPVMTMYVEAEVS
jgi:hypothetical protein